MGFFPNGKGASQIMVSVQSISIDNTNSGTTSVTKTNGATSTFLAVIDSTLPYLYLPKAVCDNFESLLGLRYDAATDLYLINATQRIANADTKIHIVVSDTTAGLKTSKEIILPYSSFDLNVSWPISDNSIPYFPIRRSVGDKAILGRTFLQEAYVIADFERNNFTVGRAVDSHSGLQTIVDIHSPLDQPSTSKKLGTGAIVGVAVGSVSGVLLAAVAIWLLFLKRKRASQASLPPNVDNKVILEDEERPGHSRHVSELSGTSTLRVRKSTFTNGDTVYEADDSGQLHELEDKTDTAAWIQNQENIQRRGTERTERFELEGEGVLQDLPEGRTPTQGEATPVTRRTTPLQGGNTPIQERTTPISPSSERDQT
jgi:hypothetical protein